MNYRVKIKLCGIEVTEAQDNAQPYIANVSLRRVTAQSALAIGSSASDLLTFALHNPFKTTFDGDKIELFVSPIEDTSTVALSAIEQTVGSDTEYEAVDTSEVVDLMNDTETGTPLTPAELADLEATEAQNINDAFNLFNGTAVSPLVIETEEEVEDEWVKLGTYYAYNQRNSSDNSIVLSCYDSFVLMTDSFEPTVKRTTIQNLYNDFRTQTLNRYGLVVDAFEFSALYNPTVNWSFDCTYRQAMEIFAGLVGGYAVIGGDDTLGITFYTYNETIVLDTDVLQFVENSAGSLMIDSIRCDRSRSPYRTDIISTGDGIGVTFANPFVTQPMLDDILSLYRGVDYLGANLSMIWNEAIQAGQFVRIMTPDEYANYVALNNALKTATGDDVLDLKGKIVSLGKTILVSNQTVDFSGDAVARIESISDTSFAKENPANSPLTGVFKDLYAETIEANEIITNRIVAVEAQVEKIDVEEISAVKGRIDNLTTKELGVEVINGNKIKDGSVVAKALSNEAVTTLSGIKLYYSADEPELISPLLTINDSVKDTFENGVITRRVGVVDMGTLSYGYTSNYFHVTSLQKKPADANLKCDALTTVENVSASNMPDMSIKGHSTSANVYIKYSSANGNTATLKNLLNGVMLYYELATPYTEQAPIEPTNYIDKDGHVMRDGDTWYKTLYINQLDWKLYSYNNKATGNGITREPIGETWKISGTANSSTASYADQYLYNSINKNPMLSKAGKWRITVSPSLPTTTGNFMISFSNASGGYKNALAFNESLDFDMDEGDSLRYIFIRLPNGTTINEVYQFNMYYLGGDGYNEVCYVWDNGEWKDYQFDGSIIRANSITAQEIATNTITANNIAGNSLTIGNMDSSVMASRGERGQMEWSDNALHIISQNEGKTEKYETEIGGDGIKFKYQDQTVASIDQDQLVIDKTLVFTEMKIGNWSWAVNPLNGNLIVKWGGK